MRVTATPTTTSPTTTSPAAPATTQSRGRQVRQLLIGLIALPLSAVPFLAYGMFTPEGRILRDRLIVAVSPPNLPELSAAEQQAAESGAPRYRGKVMALVYHGVGSTSDAEGGFVVSPGRFGEHLATLRAAGLAAVTAADVARSFAGGPALPDNAVMITFDDGRADALLFADPLLDQADMRATMFVISSATDRPNLYYAGWDRIEKAARTGRWDIEAHTHDSHRQEAVDGGEKLPVLTSLAPGESLDEYRARIETDLDRNNEAIEDHVGHKPVAFAYPFGAYGGDRTNDPRLRDILREEISARYRVAFHQDEQESVPLLDAGQDRVDLRRLEVGDWSGADLLGRIRRAAGDAGTAEDGVTSDSPADDRPLELVAPPTRGRSPRDTSPTTSETRTVRPPGPVAPEVSSATVIAEPALITRPDPDVSDPDVSDPDVSDPDVSDPDVSEPPTTTTAGPSTTTTTTQPPTSTTSSTTSSTTTTTQPTTTTTGPTTTTTRPSSGTTTTSTTDKPCRGGRGGKPCRR